MSCVVASSPTEIFSAIILWCASDPLSVCDSQDKHALTNSLIADTLEREEDH